VAPVDKQPRDCLADQAAGGPVHPLLRHLQGVVA